MPPDRRQLATVFVAAATVIGLEIASFQALCVVNDYLAATQVISVALLGLSAGGVAAAWVRDVRRGMAVASGLLPLAVLASFAAILWCNPWPAAMMAVLATPYALTACLLSLVFRALPPARVYAWDLLGAAMGTLLVVVPFPWLREEGAFLLLATLAATPALWSGRPRLGGLLVLALAAATITQIAASPLQMIDLATADRALYPDKVFFYANKQGEPLYDIRFSRGSLIERIDIGMRTDAHKHWVSIYNGRTVDVITNNEVKKGGLDNRLPTRLRWGKDPETLLVGPSGQGLTKAVRMMGDGHIDAVELNDAIAHLMTHEMFDRSGRAYDGMDLSVGDVRTWLARTDRRYDFITMLDTHRIYSSRHVGPPEFIHTVEAMRAYLDHVRDDGLVLFEERTVDRQTELGVMRFLYTMGEALRERGQELAKNTVIWELWHHCSALRFVAQPRQCDDGQRFTFLMFKATPYTPEELASLHDWQVQIAARQTDPKEYNGIVFRYGPGYPTEDRLSLVTRGEPPPKVDPATTDLSVVTDDRPFPFDVTRDHGEIVDGLERALELAGLMVLLPAFLVFRGRVGERERGAKLLGLALVPWFALLGVAYLSVELLLVQRLAIWLSSPTWSLAIVLSAMLAGSGLGGSRAAGLRKPAVLAAMGLVTLLVLGAAFGLGALVDATMALPWAARVALAVLGVGAVAVPMGLAFPWAMTVVRGRLGEAEAGLYFAINGAAGAVTAPLVLISTMDQGFHLSWLYAAGLQALCMLLLGLAPTGERAG